VICSFAPYRAQVEPSEIPLSRDNIPLLPVEPEKNLPQIPAWLRGLRNKIHM